jgi:hypothetical protein
MLEETEEMEEIEENLIPLNDLSLPYNDKSRLKSSVFRSIFFILAFLCILTFMVIPFILWLAESQFSEGILRPKYVNESCSTQDYMNRPCVTGLFCVKGTCILSTYNSSDPIIIDNTKECPEPRVCPPPTLIKTVSYYDFLEYPNSYLRNASSLLGSLDDISYNGCKELCGRDNNCEAVRYFVGTKQCDLIKKFYKGTLDDPHWISAIKT